MPSSVKKMVWFQSLSQRSWLMDLMTLTVVDVDRSEYLSLCYKALNDHKVLAFKGTLLKPNMVTPGSMPRRKEAMVTLILLLDVLQPEVLSRHGRKSGKCGEGQPPSSEGVRQTSRPPLVPTRVMHPLEMVLEEGLHVKDYKIDEVLCFSIAIL
ncbi:hypothetical protein IFM89_005680 [Coptis chinensis]|uniref:fructose-bisphosphate aldolase n=1 Tax=Coptis chinensis TaxID=261450 RepID=A0A835GWJ2_9MAGN|nr:hypothetical protein IFM89_005680 [Coptis chinensis]